MFRDCSPLWWSPLWLSLETKQKGDTLAKVIPVQNIFNKSCSCSSPLEFWCWLGSVLNEFTPFKVRVAETLDGQISSTRLDACIFYLLEIPLTLVKAKREEITFKEAELKMKTTWNKSSLWNWSMEHWLGMWGCLPLQFGQITEKNAWH